MGHKPHSTAVWTTRIAPLVVGERVSQRSVAGHTAILRLRTVHRTLPFAKPLLGHTTIVRYRLRIRKSHISKHTATLQAVGARDAVGLWDPSGVCVRPAAHDSFCDFVWQEFVE